MVGIEYCGKEEVMNALRQFSISINASRFVILDGLSTLSKDCTIKVRVKYF